MWRERQFENLSPEYKDAKDKHEEDLLEWEKEKTHFDKEAKKNYHDEVDEYEKKRVKYRKEQEDEKELGKIEGGVKHSHEKGNGLGTGPKWADMEDDEE